MDAVATRKLPVWLTTIYWWVAYLLFAWGISSVLYQYRWYFPPNFEMSDFLNGRLSHFHGTYRLAFYVHILSGPIAIVLAGLLVLSSGLKRHRQTHRFLGRILALVVIFGLLPSGIVMATKAFTGQIAGWGFASLAVATATCTIIAVNQAIKKRFKSHRQWALRSFILLCSPLLLRFVSSSLAGLEVESVWAYRLNAWLSWFLPLLVFEIFQQRANPQNLKALNPES